MCDVPLACGQLSFTVGAAILKDVVAMRTGYLFAPPQWLQRFVLLAVAGERDIPVAFLLSNILMLTHPAAAALLLVPQSTMLGTTYIIVNYALLFLRVVVSHLHKRITDACSSQVRVRGTLLARHAIFGNIIQPECIRDSRRVCQVCSSQKGSLRRTSACTADHPLLNSVPSLLLTPLFGIPSGIYRLHH